LGKNEKTFKLETRKSPIIFHLSDVFQNRVFQMQMGCFLGRAKNSELKIRVQGVSRMLVAVSGPHWW